MDREGQDEGWELRQEASAEIQNRATWPEQGEGLTRGGCRGVWLGSEGF